MVVDGHGQQRIRRYFIVQCLLCLLVTLVNYSMRDQWPPRFVAASVVGFDFVVQAAAHWIARSTRA